MQALQNARHPSYSGFTKSTTITSLPPPDQQNAGIAKPETSFLLVVYEMYCHDVTTSSWSTECRHCQMRDILPTRDFRNPSRWRHYLLLIDNLPAFPNARHLSCPWFTKSIAMTSLPLPGRQNAGHARRDTSFLHGIYEIYWYDVTTFSWSTVCRHCKMRDILPTRDLRNPPL